MTLEAFHMRCQCQILKVHWYDFITNTEISSWTRLPSLNELISSHCLAIFGHAAHLGETVPAHLAFHCHIDLSIIVHLTDHGSANLLVSGKDESTISAATPER